MRSNELVLASSGWARLSWPTAAWMAAAVMVLAVCFSLLRIPVQMTDSLIPMLQTQAAPSALSVFVEALHDRAFLRPLWWLQVRLVLAASDGNYFMAFKLWHVALLAALFVGYTKAAKVHDGLDWVTFAFSLVVLTGLHTFRGMVWEAYPINHYLEIAVCSVTALVLCQSKGGLWRDIAAIVLFVVATLTLESGLLVWVVLVAARVFGLRGVSWRAIGVVTALVLAYGYLRLSYLGTGVPGLIERQTGFGLSRMEREEALLRFGSVPYLLYAYNVASSLLSVLLSEPRGGTWGVTARTLDGTLRPGDVLNVGASLLATALIARFAVVRWSEWRAGRFTHADQLVLIFAAVAVANAALCFVYTKDEVLSTAGVFYALAMAAASRDALGALTRVRRARLLVAAASLVLLIVSGGWTVRATGLHYQLAYMGFKVRNEWPEVDSWLAGQHVTVATPESRRLVLALQTAAIEKPVLNIRFLPRWGDDWFE